MVMGEPEEGRREPCFQCGGVNGDHDDGCAQRPIETMPPATERRPITVSLCVAHTPWVAERVESMKRLRGELGIGENLDELPEGGPIAYRAITEKARNEVWSESMWRWAAETEADWTVFLQDDARVAPNFWPALGALLEALPEGAEVLGLEVVHPAARALATDGVRLFTTSDYLVGVAYAVKRTALLEFLRWRRDELVDGWKTGGIDGKTAITEDTLVGTWCLVTGRRIYHPLPTLVDHDTSIASTYGNDDHVNRRPLVRWDNAEAFADEHGPPWDARDPELLEGAGFWMGRCRTIVNFAPDGTFMGIARAMAADPKVLTGRGHEPHLGHFYDATPKIAARWVKGVDAKALSRMRGDTGTRELRRLAYVKRARRDYTPTDRVLVCTPTRTGLEPETADTVNRLLRLVEVDVDGGFEVLDAWRWHEDVVRVRSRFLHRAFEETEATAVHFLDADVCAESIALLGMLATKRPIVCAPYPRRDSIRFEQVAKNAGDWRPPESHAYRYPVGVTPGRFELESDQCAEVDWAPLGCSVIRREAAEKMVAHYRKLEGERVDLAKLPPLGEIGRRPLEELVHRLRRDLERWEKGQLGLCYRDLDPENEDREMVALFQLLNRDRLWGEDQSFCFRARDAHVPVALYLGPGSPVDHIGTHRYRGHVEAFGLARGTPEQLARIKAHLEAKKVDVDTARK